MPILCKYDVIYKTGSAKSIATLVEKDRVTAVGNMHKNFVQIGLHKVKGKGRPYSTAKHWVLELIPVLGSQPAGGVSHKLNGRLPLLSTRPAVTLVTLKRAATNFAVW